MRFGSSGRDDLVSDDVILSLPAAGVPLAVLGLREISMPIERPFILGVCRLSVALGACSTALLGCAREEASNGTESNLSDTHLDANNCELFVDKVIPVRGSHGSRRLSTFIKTLNDRLDSPPARVGMRYAIHDPDHSCQSGFSLAGCGEVGPFADHDAREAAADYFELDLEIANDATFRHQYEGVVYVVTQKGTTYWHKTATKTNFFIDDETLDNVENSLHGKGITTPIFAGMPDSVPDPLPKTADFFDYLNSGRCR
jgi:hypothetical protein